MATFSSAERPVDLTVNGAPSPRLALDAALKALPNLDTDILPPGFSFARRLEDDAAANELIRKRRLGDYLSLALQLNQSIEALKEHVRFHSMEAEAIVRLGPAGQGVLLYISDVARWVSAIDRLVAEPPERLLKGARWLP